MKSKLLTSILFASFLLVFSLAAVSALSISLVSQPTNAYSADGSLVFTLNVTNNNDTYAADALVLSGTTNLGTLSFPPVASIPANSSKLVNVTLNFPVSTTTVLITGLNATATLNSVSTLSNSLSLSQITLSTPLQISVSPSILTRNSNTSTITIKNNGNTNLFSVALSTSDSTVILSQSSISLNAGAQTTVTLTATDFSNAKVGTPKAVTITANTSTTSATATLNLETSFCDSGEIGTNLTIDSLNIDNQGTGDESEWYLLDGINVEIDAANNNPDSDNKISTDVEIELYDTAGKAYLKLDKVKLGRIYGDDTETAKFNFTVPANFKGDKAYLYVKVYQDGKESQICSSKISSNEYKKEITISRESDNDKQMAIYDEVISPDVSICGTDSTYSFNVANVGDSSQKKVKIEVVSKELGIDSYVIVSNLDEGDKAESKTFTLSIPQNVVEKEYDLYTTLLYNYNDDEDATLNSAYDDSRTYSNVIKVQGSKCTPANGVKSATISASDFQSLNADVRPLLGSDVTFKLPIKSSGNLAANFTVSIIGNDAWSVATLDPASLTLAPGEIRNVDLYLQIKKDVNEGNKTFSVVVKSEGNIVLSQEFSIPVEKGLTMERMLNNIKTNWVVYAIVLVNLILIIAIILVVRSLLRK